MSDDCREGIARRRLLAAALAAPALSIAPGFPLLTGRALAATPACGDAATAAQIEGPFFRPSSPRRSMLVGPDEPGIRMVLTGRVLTRRCRPLAGAIVDVWHADATGAYDNDGYRCRGHQLTDVEGRFSFETVVPGLYPGRTRHVHVKVGPPDRRPLTTQLYFPDEPDNSRDRLFRRTLLIAMAAGSPQRAAFDFVLDLP